MPTDLVGFWMFNDTETPLYSLPTPDGKRDVLKPAGTVRDLSGMSGKCAHHN